MNERRPRLDVLTTVAFEGPAAIADRAQARGVAVQVHSLYAGAPVPVVGDVERLVVMGGPMGAHDDASHPWLPTVRALLADAVAAGTPVLGVCLGAQLVAAACGAAVFTGPAPEIGPGTVRVWPAGAVDPIFSVVDGDELGVFHWHGDTFDLPDGATLLASSDRYVNQAFRVANAWGLQFHVELRARDAAAVSSHLGSGRSVDAAALAAIAPVGARLIDAFLDVPARDPQPGSGARRPSDTGAS